MDYRRLGKSGLQVSELSLGSWVTFGKQVDEKEAMSLMTHAYDEGINFFDNAEGYEAGASEALMGQALSKLGFSRDSFIVSSKVFWGGSKPTQRGLSRKHVFDAAHAAMKRLQVDYLDLYFCHRPDVDTPIEETVRAMHDLVQQGKVLYWGGGGGGGHVGMERPAADRSLGRRQGSQDHPAADGTAAIQSVRTPEGRRRLCAAV